MASPPEPPEDDAPPGVPEWVVTYGDMMSLLLTFFIMLVSMSEIQEEQRYRDVLASLHDRLGYAGAPEAVPGDDPPGPPMTSEVRKDSGAAESDSDGTGGTGRPTAPGPNTQIRYAAPGRPVPAGPPLAFAPGSSTLDDEGRLDALADRLRGKRQKVELVGFAPRPADARRVPAAEAVAFARARAVLDALVARGVRPGRFRLAARLTDPIADGAEDTDPDAPPADRVEVDVLDALATDPRLR